MTAGVLRSVFYIVAYLSKHDDWITPSCLHLIAGLVRFCGLTFTLFSFRRHAKNISFFLCLPYAMRENWQCRWGSMRRHHCLVILGQSWQIKVSWSMEFTTCFDSSDFLYSLIVLVKSCNTPHFSLAYRDTNLGQAEVLFAQVPPPLAIAIGRLLLKNDSFCYD